MSDYDYLIIGGGMTGDAAVKGIREQDPQGSIGLFSKENNLPYKRPPLSKGLWTGKKQLKDIWMNTPQDKATFNLTCEITRIDPQAKSVIDQEGNVHTYRKLLLASGGKPRRLNPDVPGLIYYRTLNDYERLSAEAGPGKHFVVVGGGFIGSEIAAALNMSGSQVTEIFPEDGIGARVYPADLSLYVTDYYRQKGVDIRARESVTGIVKDGAGYRVQTKASGEIKADGVVVGIGIQPNTGLAEAAGLKVDNGIWVDENLRAGSLDIFAAGDVANFYNPALDEHMRVEHEDNALTMGQNAGRNMALERLGRPLQAYTHLPYFYSDMFELGYEAVGKLDSRLQVAADWKEPFKKGVLYYLDGGRVKGVLLWNVWDTVPAARELIAHPERYSAGERL